MFNIFKYLNNHGNLLKSKQMLKNMYTLTFNKFPLSVPRNATVWLFCSVLTTAMAVIVLLGVWNTAVFEWVFPSKYCTTSQITEFELEHAGFWTTKD